MVNFTIRDKFFSGKNKKANCLLIFNNKFLEIAKLRLIHEKIGDVKQHWQIFAEKLRCYRAVLPTFNGNG